MALQLIYKQISLLYKMRTTAIHPVINLAIIE